MGVLSYKMADFDKDADGADDGNDDGPVVVSFAKVFIFLFNIVIYYVRSTNQLLSSFLLWS